MKDTLTTDVGHSIHAHEGGTYVGFNLSCVKILDLIVMGGYVLCCIGFAHPVHAGA